ncbi:hypothetical protein CUC08_Gglean007949 [Alternaria sp. MG1]|nr:hypothetical protein CUC08_Gglean007949 [Alternaria sp. MG1]
MKEAVSSTWCCSRPYAESGYLIPSFQLFSFSRRRRRRLLLPSAAALCSALNNSPSIVMQRLNEAFHSCISPRPLVLIVYLPPYPLGAFSYHVDTAVPSFAMDRIGPLR